MSTWQILWSLLRYRPWLTLIGLTSWVLISLVPVSLGLVARAFFDALASGAPGGFSLWWLVALPMLLQGGRLLVTWVSVPLNITHRFTIHALLSRNLFAHILSLPGARALKGTPGEVISLFRDDVEEVATFTSVLRLLSVAGECLTVVVILGVMLRINAFVTFFTVLPLLAVVLLARAATGRIHQYRQASREATGQVTGALGEFFGMVQVIRLAGAERLVAERVRRLGDLRREATVADSLFGELLRSLFFSTAHLGTGLVLLLAAGAMRAGTFTVGDFALFAAYVGRVSLFTGIVGDLLGGYRQTGVSLGRLHALMNGAPPGALAAHTPLHLDGPLPDVTIPLIAEEDRLVRLEVDGLTFRYPESGRGVSAVSLSLDRGSFTVITGRVGSGKSTLLRALQGLVPAQAGTIRWNGVVVADPATHFQPPYSSYTPQAPFLFSGTLQENILLGLPTAEADLQAALRSAVLEQDVAGLERGVETEIGARGVRLSGGQVQRTAAARMLVRAPELLLFDDLSSALDTKTELLLWERLRQGPERTCLAVSHRPAALRAADQIIVMEEGRVAATGTLERLLAESAEFRAIWNQVAEPSGAA